MCNEQSPIFLEVLALVSSQTIKWGIGGIQPGLNPELAFFLLKKFGLRKCEREHFLRYQPGKD